MTTKEKKYEHLIDPSQIDILIVEDSPTQAIKLQMLLDEQGYQVSVAQDGQMALEIMETYRPTMVVSDIMMPQMDGYQLCQAIKENEQLKNIPVILLTSLSDPHDVINGLRCQADNFITKPYEDKFLLSRIRHILINQYLRKSGHTEMGLNVFFAGQEHYLTSERIQIIDMLLSTFEEAVQKNRDLEEANKRLAESEKKLKQQAEELHALSLKDELTGLYNRRGFYTLVEQQLKLAERTKTKLSLLFIDLDGMKIINDTYGHEEGDRALKRTAAMLKKSFRESDIIARLGGDEFVVLFVNDFRDGHAYVMDRLSDNIAIENQANPQLPPYQIALSRGIAQYDPDNPVTLDELLSRADELMYQHKGSKKGNKSLHET